MDELDQIFLTLLIVRCADLKIRLRFGVVGFAKLHKGHLYKLVSLYLRFFGYTEILKTILSYLHKGFISTSGLLSKIRKTFKQFYPNNGKEKYQK